MFYKLYQTKGGTDVKFTMSPGQATLSYVTVPFYTALKEPAIRLHPLPLFRRWLI